MIFNAKNLAPKQLQAIYKSLLYPRLIEEKMLLLLRQGKIGKWFSGIGQEAIAVGCTLALEDDEYILPMHRNLGVFTCRNIPLWKLMAQWQGKATGFTKGRDRSFHFGSKENHIIGMISHLGPQLAIADGIALANKLNNANKVCLAFTGEGATSEGDFHEALNLAAVWDLPVIFVVENNGYAMGTSVTRTSNVTDLYTIGEAYDMPSEPVDAMSVEAVHEAVSRAAERARAGEGPTFLEFKTYRYRGHSMSDAQLYRSKEEVEEYKKIDPITQVLDIIKEKKYATETEIEAIDGRVKDLVQECVDFAESSPYPELEQLYDVVYAQEDYPFTPHKL